jgi:hypothetical protein
LAEAVNLSRDARSRLHRGRPQGRAKSAGEAKGASDVSESKPPQLEYASREQQPWFVMHWGGWLMVAAIAIAAAFLAYKQVIAG